MAVDAEVVLLKDKAVRLWIACGHDSHVAAAITRADKTLTMEIREIILDHLAKLHQLYNP